jgi:hypothetical protein
MPEVLPGTARKSHCTNRAVIGFISHDLVFSSSMTAAERALIMRAIKRLKGISWMPWWQEAMKDVVRCDKLWGGANNL